MVDINEKSMKILNRVYKGDNGKQLSEIRKVLKSYHLTHLAIIDSMTATQKIRYIERMKPIQDYVDSNLSEMIQVDEKICSITSDTPITELLIKMFPSEVE